jgi:hypothetical protein
MSYEEQRGDDALGRRGNLVAKCINLYKGADINATRLPRYRSQ